MIGCSRCQSRPKLQTGQPWRKTLLEGKSVGTLWPLIGHVSFVCFFFFSYILRNIFNFFFPCHFIRVNMRRSKGLWNTLLGIYYKRTFLKKEKANLTFNLTPKSTGQYVIEFLITVLINTVLVDLIRITNILHLFVLLSRMELWEDWSKKKLHS